MGSLGKSSEELTIDLVSFQQALKLHALELGSFLGIRRGTVRELGRDFCSATSGEQPGSHEFFLDKEEAGRQDGEKATLAIPHGGSKKGFKFDEEDSKLW